VGQRGLRIQNIVNELAGEKIDVVQWSNEPVTYISHALSPAKVNAVLLDDNSSIKTATVVVPDRQLSLAIGKEGQNARLAAKLTGWRIDIKSESEAEAEGLMRLVAERAQKAAPGEDLLARAERILLEEKASPPEDRLSRAARALETMVELPSETVDLPSLVDLPPLEPLPTGDAFKWDAVVEEFSKTELPSLPIFDEEAEEETPVAKPPAVEPELPFAPAPEETKPAEPVTFTVTAGEQLPEVITADMLRARRGQRKGLSLPSDSFEVPEELLVGYKEKDAVEEDWEEEEGGAKSKDKGKGKEKTKGKKASLSTKPDKKPKKQKRWRPIEDEGEDYY
jgi:N utilization substance protein A